MFFDNKYLQIGFEEYAEFHKLRFEKMIPFYEDLPLVNIFNYVDDKNINHILCLFNPALKIGYMVSVDGENPLKKDVLKVVSTYLAAWILRDMACGECERCKHLETPCSTLLRFYKFLFIVPHRSTSSIVKPLEILNDIGIESQVVKDEVLISRPLKHVFAAFDIKVADEQVYIDDKTCENCDFPVLASDDIYVKLAKLSTGVVYTSKNRHDIRQAVKGGIIESKFKVQDRHGFN